MWEKSMLYVLYYFLAGFIYAVADVAISKRIRIVYSKSPFLFFYQILRWPASICRRLKNLWVRKNSEKIIKFTYTKDDSSQYRQWLTKDYQYSCLYPPELTQDMEVKLILHSLLGTACSFKMEKDPFSETHDDRENNVDLAIFEVACYLLAISKQCIPKPSLARELEILEKSKNLFFEISSDILKISVIEIRTLVDYRNQVYGSEKEPIGSITTFILESQELGTPIKQLSSLPSLNLGQVWISTNVAIWVTAMLPVFAKMLKGHIANFYKDDQASRKTVESKNKKTNDIIGYTDSSGLKVVIRTKDVSLISQIFAWSWKHTGMEKDDALRFALLTFSNFAKGSRREKSDAKVNITAAMAWNESILKADNMVILNVSIHCTSYILQNIEIIDS